MAPETADALVLYGKALLGNAIAQSAVLGGGPDGQPAEQTEAAVRKSSLFSFPDPKRNSTLIPAESAVAGPSSVTAPTAANWKFSFGGDEPDDEGEGDQEEEGEEDDGVAGVDRDDELEDAFNVLDMARAIFAKMDGNEAKQKRADVHKLLGEVAQESGECGFDVFWELFRLLTATRDRRAIRQCRDRVSKRSRHSQGDPTAS